VSKNNAISNHVQEDLVVFTARSSRCHGLLHFIACRVLSDTKGARDAVQNCWLTASRHSPKFEHEGAFRSWLLRIVIDDALAIRRMKKESISDRNLHVASSSESPGAPDALSHLELLTLLFSRLAMTQELAPGPTATTK
jgi:DNA-directed RNA polymerase specialized sigma24 family protein